MNDLFDRPQTYPHAPGYARNRPTSRRAAETVWKPTERQQLILSALERGGYTDHELSHILGLQMCVIQPRRSDLTALGKVIDSGLRRLTPFKKQAVVWKLSN